MAAILTSLSKIPRVSLFFVALWVFTLISLPIVGWVWGTEAQLRGMSMGVLMQALAVMAALFPAWGLRRTAQAFLLVGVLSYLAELIGSSTGIPFGRYHYTDLLQPQLVGVPLLIPLAWMMMLPPAWAIARLALPSAPRLAHALLSAAAFTAWDLFLDPQMVMFGFWVWEQPGEYFGIPLVNYLGWFLVSTLLTLAARPKDLPLAPLALIYVLTWLLQSVGQGIFWGQPLPALAGFIGCGIFVWLAVRRNIP